MDERAHDVRDKAHCLSAEGALHTGHLRQHRMLIIRVQSIVCWSGCGGKSLVMHTDTHIKMNVFFSGGYHTAFEIEHCRRHDI